ncbi:hypothetical protein JVU11DRAFT_1548 [Chiua virens]|nr:hypothetical protein JVU11DRAFT_1548 [Chiua virens]
MADESVLKKLSAETRAKLRSTQILTSLPTIISELLQNAIDSGASQIDIGVDCTEWSCWVMDNGLGFTKEGLRTIGQDSERGRYNSSKAYTPATLETVSTFGFRGEALASMADLSCLEISSRTIRSRQSWSVIVKAGKSLYAGPSIRWRRESPGTVVSIRDAFFNLPVRRQSHPTPNKTIELIRQEVEAYALVFPNTSFSFQDASKTKESHPLHKSHILKIPMTRSTLAAFRHFYGRAFTEESVFLFGILVHDCHGACISQCVEEITATSGQLRIEGFISLVGAYAKLYIVLCLDVNKHPISFCDLHRLIDNRFAASTFAKHAYDEGGETSLRPSARRSPRKGEKKPVYVLNLIIPVKHIDNCLEPSKSAVELDNKNAVTSFLSETIQSFLVHHSFAPDKTRHDTTEDGNRRKKRKVVVESLATSKTPSSASLVEKGGTSNASDHAGDIPVIDAQKSVWKDPSTGERFILDNRTGNSYHLSTDFTVDRDRNESIGATSGRRTLQIPRLIAEESCCNIDNTGDPVPIWLQEALQANDAFALKEPRIPSLPTLVTQDTDRPSFQALPQLSHKLSNSACDPQSKDDLRKARIISQVDRKFIACVVDSANDDALGAEENDGRCNDAVATGGKTLILIDQHAADERVRVERFLKSICRGFLSHQEESGGVETKQLNPAVPVLLTKHEASRLAALPCFQKAFESWGFRFSGLKETQSRLECETEPDGSYAQVFVSAIPEIVSEKLLLGKEMQELIKGYIGALESRELEPRDPSSQHDSTTLDEETQWLKALRWCPRELVDLINSKACRGAIMFNDPLNIEQCERLVKQLSMTVFPFQCAHGRPTLVPLTRLTGGRKERGIKWEKVATP